MRPLFLLFVLVLSIGCAADGGGDDAGGPAPDAAADAVADAVAPRDAAVPSDSVADSVALPDALDAGPGPDVPPDTAPDTAVDVPADVPEDVPLLPLVANGASPYRIVLEPTASPSERTAAEELRAYLAEATGVELPVVEGAPEDGDGPRIVVGAGPIAAALGVAPTAEELGEQGFALATVGEDVVIAGTPGAGTLYGVHRFLEAFVGVRWWAPGVTDVPQTDRLGVPPLDRVERPGFLWRHTSWAWPGADTAFRTRQTQNAGDATADDPWGLQHAHDGRAHSYFTFVSPDEFFDEHPEYFSEIGGVRVRDETQLCLTNPDVLEIVTERMLQRMADRPTVRQHNFSQMDHYNYCTCDRCAAMNAQYGTYGGTQFWFLNQLAERTAAVFPDKQVSTLAYMYTEEPPVGLEMHPNVAVWLCHMYPSCDSHPIATCPRNADYKRRALAWSALTRHLYVWHYTTDFTHYYVPFPNLRGMAANLRFYRDIGVEGVFLQGMGHSGGGGELSLLRPYYLMHLAWDPDRDPDALVDEFLAGYHGAAAPPLRAYLDLLHDEVEREDIHMHLYTNPAQGYLSDTVLAEANRLFDEAEALVADDPERLDRVKVARLPLAYAKFFPRNGYHIECDPAGGAGRVCWLRWSGARSTMGEVRAFVDTLAAHGFRTVREASGDASTMTLLNGIVSLDQRMELLENEHLTVEIVPALAGRALRIVDRASGECVTAYDVRRNLFFPFGGGLEDRTGELFSFFGWVEPAGVVGRGDGWLRVALDTFDGFHLERTYRLAPDAPVLTVTSVLTNPTAEARELRLRNHIELDLGELRATRVRFTDRAGATVDEDMNGVVDGLREGEHFRAERAPAGEWTLSGTKGLAVTQRFDADAIDFTWLYAYPEEDADLELEVWSRRAVVPPGESLTLEHELEIRPVAR